MKQVDLNCDLGESFGTYTIGQDEKVLPLISSANIAAAFMEATVGNGADGSAGQKGWSIYRRPSRIS